MAHVFSLLVRGFSSDRTSRHVVGCSISRHRPPRLQSPAFFFPFLCSVPHTPQINARLHYSEFGTSVHSPENSDLLTILQTTCREVSKLSHINTTIAVHHNPPHNYCCTVLYSSKLTRHYCTIWNTRNPYLLHHSMGKPSEERSKH